jgi:Uma2 family endonuclease
MEQHSGKKLSLFEFDNLIIKDENKYELIDVIVLMSPRSTIKHQEIMGTATTILGNQ